MTKTIAALIKDHPDAAEAIGAPDRTWLTHGKLRGLCTDVATTLRGLGIGQGDRVAIVLPNGPEMATAFVTVAQVATTAPLNPSYTEDEYAFYLADLKAKAIIIIAADDDGPAIAAATFCGVAILRLAFDVQDPAGVFTLSSDADFGAANSAALHEDDIALILHTSGTTSRPKIVLLSQANVFALANNIQRSLTPHD